MEQGHVSFWWTQFLILIGSLTIIMIFVQKAFGWDAIGKKVPAWLYKLFMRNSIQIRELKEQNAKILSQIEYNGGKRKMNDALQEIEGFVQTNTEMLREILFRQDINDIVTNQMVLRLDENGECIFVNTAFLKTFGYIESEMEGHGWESMLDDGDTKRLYSKIQRAIDIKSSFRDELSLQTSSGKQIETKIIGHPYIGRDTFTNFYVMVYLINK